MDFNLLTKKQIVEMINHIAPIANSKIKSVRSANLENYNQSWIKKYNITINNDVNPNMVTKKGYFRKGGYSKFTKEQLIHRYEVMNEFVTNRYASADYTQQHLSELQEKWGLKNDESIKRMFDLYREYGYDNYKDSETLVYMSKILSDNEEDPEILEDILWNLEQSMYDDSAGYGAPTEQDFINELKAAAGILK